MSNATEALKGMAKFYEDTVAECDSKGYADTYKKAAKRLFNALKKDSFTIKDVKYLDGYYLFGSGTNSVVHFHINEIPGWKFGIWWNEPKKYTNTEDNTDLFVEGTLFTQYEETIDKFKPAASSIKESISVPTKRPVGRYDFWHLTRILSFMEHEPELSFCKDHCYWDEWDYHTREEAIEEFKKYKRKKAAQDKYEAKFNKKYLDWGKAVCEYLGKGAKIIDNGDYCSPRYGISCKMPNKKFDVEESGWYGLFDDDIELDAGLIKLKKKWDKLAEEVEQVNNTTDAYIFTFDYFDPVVAMYEPKEKKKK